MAVNTGYVVLSGANTSWGGLSGYTSAQILPANANRKRVLINNYLQWTVFGSSGLHLSGTLYGSGNYFQPQENLPFEVTDKDSVWAIGFSGDVVSFLEESSVPTLPDVQVFNSGSWSWTKPSGATIVDVTLIGGGGGGGGGGRGSQLAGAQGVPNGGIGRWVFRASDLNASENVNVGAGGIGAAGATTDNTPSSNATPGGATTFGTNYQAGIYPWNQSSIGQGGNGAGNNQGLVSLSGAVGKTGLIGYASGGQPGGGWSGGNGNSGVSVIVPFIGGGGGGGGYSSGSPGGNGGNGGNYGAGGGGGGVADNGHNGGNGGNGAPGVAIVISW